MKETGEVFSKKELESELVFVAFKADGAQGAYGLYVRLVETAMHEKMHELLPLGFRLFRVIGC